MEDKTAVEKMVGEQGPGEDVRKRKYLLPEDKLQIYREYVVAKAGKHGEVGELMRNWNIHSTDLKRIADTVEGGALQEFKERKCRRPRVSMEEVEALRAGKICLEQTIVALAAENAVIKKKWK